MSKRYNKVEILTYYALDEGYISFPENLLNNKIFNNVTVKIKKENRKICGIDFEYHVIYIENEEPIECELVNKTEYDDTLILKICQDWG